MPPMKERVCTLATLPNCEVCKIYNSRDVKVARYDSQLALPERRTQWGYSCSRHHTMYGVGIATRLQTSEEAHLGTH